MLFFRLFNSKQAEYKMRREKQVLSKALNKWVIRNLTAEYYNKFLKKIIRIIKRKQRRKGQLEVNSQISQIFQTSKMPQKNEI